MAKIKGLEIRNMIKFNNRDGEELTQGVIYLHNKKIGTYSDGMRDDGEYAIDVPDGIIQDIASRYFKEHPEELQKRINGRTYVMEPTAGRLIRKIIELNKYEEEYQRASRLWSKNIINIIRTQEGKTVMHAWHNIEDAIKEKKKLSEYRIMCATSIESFNII